MGVGPLIASGTEPVALNRPHARTLGTGARGTVVGAAHATCPTRTTTRPAHPHGCMGVQGALATGDPGRGVRDLLAAWRNDGCSIRLPGSSGSS